MMKKKLLSVLLCLTMLATLLVGCGSKKETSTNAKGTDSGKAITLKWAIWDKDLTPYWVALKDAYEAAHKNVTIELTDLGSATT